jgi:hypothetical protein
MCAGWCTAATTAALDIVFWRMGTMRKGVTLGLVGWNGTAEDASYFYKVRRRLFPFVWCANICWKLYHFADYPFHTTFYLSKAALLSVYLQVFPSFMVKRRRFLWAVIAYVAASYTTTILLLTCICLPTWRYWSVLHSICRTSGSTNFCLRSLTEEGCSIASIRLTFQIAWSLNIVGDILSECI